MMKKQEVIEAIENERTNCDDTIWGGAYDEAIDDTLAIVRQLDEPEKAVLNEEEAEWLGRLKKAKSFLNCLYIITRQGWGHDFEFYVHEEKYKLSYRDDNDEDSEQTKNRLVNALIYGYEVEEEKVYTVKFSNEDFGKTYIGIIKTANKIGISTVPMNDECSKCYFTKSELEEFKFWNNPAFEIKEVTE